jgi:hypothetical protein
MASRLFQHALPEPISARRFDGPCNGSKRSSTFPLSPDFSAWPHIGRTAASIDRPIRKSILDSNYHEGAETPFVLDERTGDRIIRKTAD